MREERVDDLLNRYRDLEPFQILNRGDPYALGTDVGLTPEFIRSRIEALGDVCLWCDEYFDNHYTGPHGERRKEAADHGIRAMSA